LRGTTRWVRVNEAIAIGRLVWYVHLPTFHHKKEGDDSDSQQEYLCVVHLHSIDIFLSREIKMTVAVLIKEQFGDIQEIDLDIEPSKNEIFLRLGGPATFIGQWPDLDVVIIKCTHGESLNQNTLPTPFKTEEVHGPILLVRMDENSDPRDFTLEEYLGFVRGDESVAV
jgi:hypothetical protein